jgi:hypothetical protein
MAGKAICSIDGCNNPVLVKSRGWCSKHYQRWQHTGDPTLSRIDREQTGKSCSVRGCGKAAGYRGMCQAHYKRANRYGDPEAYHPDYLHVRRWLEDHSDYQGDDCLKWPFSVGDNGRGTVAIDGVNISAPRAMCMLAHGEPPTPEHETAHNCGKGHEGCINPRHLRWDTAAGNHADKVLHGTIVRGEAVNTAKLNEDQVRYIRRLNSISRKDLAEMFGVSVWTIWEIRTRRSWAWLD